MGELADARVRRSRHWPTAIVEISDDVVSRMPRQDPARGEFAERALLPQIGVVSSDISSAFVTLPGDRVGVCLPEDSRLTQWLHEAASRRGTSVAEVLHAAFTDAINAAPNSSGR